MNTINKEEQLENTKKNKKQQTGLKLNSIESKTISQKKFFKDFHNYQAISLSGYAGTGKAQPLDCKILTPSGWIQMGDITVGTKIIDKDGNTCNVTAIYPQGITECYKLTFSDGSSTRCHGDHLWLGWLSKHGSKKSILGTYTLNEIKNNLNQYKNCRFSIPIYTPPTFEDTVLPIDPYLLGILIGDGCLRRGVMFSTSDEHILDNISKIVKRDYYNLFIRKTKDIDYFISGGKSNKNVNKLILDLKELGLMGKLSYDKFIPEIYKNASISQTKELIRGLLDSDGTVGKRNGDVSFSTVSAKLADDFCYLIRKLGGKSSIKERKTKSKFGIYFCVSVSIKDKQDLFKLERKRELINKKFDEKQNRRKLVSITRLEDCETRCITVDSPSHTYVTDDFIVTHNTFIALHSALNAVIKGLYNELVIIRSAVPSRDIGFMPGNKKEKMEVYEGPYISLCSKLFGRGDAYSILKQKGVIRFESSSFLRGETFENCVIIIDEAQNMAYNELYTILTRIGENSKIVICGDALQDDLTSERYREFSGYVKMLEVLKSLDSSCLHIEFTADEIVRSGFVRDLILATQR